MAGSFTQKIIEVHFTLAHGLFTSGFNTKVVKNLRVEVEIRKPGTPTKNECELKIYGMLPEDINTLSTSGVNPLAVQKNLVQVQAGDSDGLTTLFQGEITGAWANYATPPNLDLEVHAITGYYPSIAPTTPITAKGASPAAALFQTLATKMELRFENNGVNLTTQNPYLHGSPMTQAQQLADMLGIEFGVDDGVLFIAPRGGIRPPKGSTPVISPATGMKGYPIWNKQYLSIECLMNPLFQLGGAVVIEKSLVTRANGTWRIHGLEHKVSARHHGNSVWLSKLQLVKVGV